MNTKPILEKSLFKENLSKHFIIFVGVIKIMMIIFFSLLLLQTPIPLANSVNMRCLKNLKALEDSGLGNLNFGEKSGLPKQKLWEILGEGKPVDQYRKAREYVKNLPKPKEEALLPQHVKKMADILYDCFKEIDRSTVGLSFKERWLMSDFKTGDGSYGFVGHLGEMLIIRQLDGKIFRAMRAIATEPLTTWTPDYTKLKEY
jgi:hypothetical protein